MSFEIGDIVALKDGLGFMNIKNIKREIGYIVKCSNKHDTDFVSIFWPDLDIRYDYYHATDIILMKSTNFFTKLAFNPSKHHTLPSTY